MRATDVRERVAGGLANTSAVSLGTLAVLLLAVTFVFHAGPSEFAEGLYYGCIVALAALGIVLVYRSNRIINFAQLSLGTVTVTLFTQLTVHRSFLVILHGVCGDCIADPATATGAAVAVNYALSAFLSLIFAPLCALALYLVIVRALTRASRLVATVATIGAALIFQWCGGKIQDAFNPRVYGSVPNVDVAPPGNLSWHVGTAAYDTGAVLTVIVTALVLAGLLAFFRWSRLGIAIRAASENEERARSLGISPVAVQSVVWVFAGMLAGLAAELSAMASGRGGTGTTTASVLLGILAAAVIGRFESLPIAALAAIVIGIVSQALVAANVDRGISDLVTALIIVGVILLRPTERLTRAERAGGSWLTMREVRRTPRVLAHLAPVRRWRFGVGALTALVMVGIPFVLSPTDTLSAGQFLIYGMVALSLLVLSGWAGQVSLGQFAISGVAAYVTALLGGTYGVPAPVLVPLAAVSGSITAVIIGLPSLRVRGLYLAVTTLALAQLAQTVLFSQSLGGKFLPQHLERFSILGLDASDERTFYYLLLFCAAISVVLVLGVRSSRTGRALLASRDNEQGVQAFGISLLRARLQALALSGFIAGGAGALMAYQLGTIDAGTFAPEFSETILLMLVLGGLGSVAGPFLGAMYLGALTLMVGSAPDVDAALGVGVVVLLVLAPGGLAQVAYGIRDAFLRRVADRFHIVVPSLFAASRVESGGRLRVPLAPKRSLTGGSAFVPRRYRLDRVPENVAAIRRGTGA